MRPEDVRVILQELRTLAAQIDRQKTSLAKAIAMAEQLAEEVALPAETAQRTRARGAGSN